MENSEENIHVDVGVEGLNNRLLFFGLTARHDALFVVGPLEETMLLRGMRYHPVDIENTVTRCHRSICER